MSIKKYFSSSIELLSQYSILKSIKGAASSNIILTSNDF